MRRAGVFQVGDYVRAIAGCCEPGLVGRVVYISQHKRNLQVPGKYHEGCWVRLKREEGLPVLVWFSEAVASRHSLHSGSPLGADAVREVLVPGDRCWWFHPKSLRHSNERVLSE